jgi:2-keto-4-pentenoate hydratase/2-oxohepta-3-ene-1,7-dioic acid hydratase in catechol pathway
VPDTGGGQSSLAGPDTVVHLPEDGRTDWEAELVAVIGRPAKSVRAADAFDHVAGIAVGQDLSERTRQLQNRPPQFSLAKSYPRFSPVGQWGVTLDEPPDPDDLKISCELDGEVVQHGRMSDLIFGIADLVEELSAVVHLRPGDLIFTGTPSGVGVARDPQRFLQPGQRLVTRIEGVGELFQEFR